MRGSGRYSGAFDHTVSRAQERTLYGLTVALSSKTVYNVMGQLATDVIDNLDFFAMLADKAIAFGDENRRPFQELTLLMRDWRFFDEPRANEKGTPNRHKWSMNQCEAQMKDHLKKHLEGGCAEHTAIAERMRNAFSSVNLFALPPQAKSWQAAKSSGAFATRSCAERVRARTCVVLFPSSPRTAHNDPFTWQVGWRSRLHRRP